MLKKQKNSKIQGNVGVGIAIGYFVEKGYIVCVPLTDSQQYDLVIDNGLLERVQVKTTYNKSRWGSYVVELRTRTHAKGKVYGVKGLGDVDYVFVLTEEDVRYLIPITKIKTKTSIILHKEFDKYIV